MTRFTPAIIEQHSPADRERSVHVDFAVNHSAMRFREVQEYAHASFATLNARFWSAGLRTPHIGFDGCPARAVAKFSVKTGYGADIQYHVHPGFALGAKAEWVLRPFPAQGFRRAMDDVMLALMVEHAAFERLDLVKGDSEFSGATLKEANRVGAELRLAEVVARRRGKEDAHRPVVAGWPFNVRLLADPGYYGDDVTPYLLHLAQGAPAVAPSGSAGARVPLTAAEHFYVAYMNGKHRRMLASLKLLMRAQDERHFKQLPARSRAVESGRLHVDGESPLPPVSIDPAWLRFNGGAVVAHARNVLLYREFDAVPVLADLLEDAGCADQYLLGHLRGDLQHGPFCWAVKAVLDAAKKNAPKGGS